MTPSVLQTDDSGKEPVIKLQLSGNIIGAILTLLGMGIAGLLFVAGKTDRAEVKEIVNDRVSTYERQADQILIELRELRKEIGNSRSVSR